MYTDLRLKLIHFVRRHKKVIFIVFLIWLVIFIINQYLKSYNPPVAPETTYTPQRSVMNPSSQVPKTVHTKVEENIEKYIEYCNDGNYQRAFMMISEDCREYEFNNNIIAFQQYVLTKMPNPKKHSVQNYSNYDGMYIYQVKYTDDFLATGLTNQEYSYAEEKISFQVEKDGTLQMSVGNFIRATGMKSVIENDYLKIDITEKIVRYSMESYKVKFTNRTDFTIVIADGIEQEEVMIQLPQEYRARLNLDDDIILKPNESKELVLEFAKFVDTGDKSQSIVFNAIRVMEQYSGVSTYANEESYGSNIELIKKEIDDAISKFSMQIPLIEGK